MMATTISSKAKKHRLTQSELLIKCSVRRRKGKRKNDVRYQK